MTWLSPNKPETNRWVPPPVPEAPPRVVPQPAHEASVADRYGKPPSLVLEKLREQLALKQKRHAAALIQLGELRQLYTGRQAELPSRHAVIACQNILRQLTEKTAEIENMRLDGERTAGDLARIEQEAAGNE